MSDHSTQEEVLRFYRAIGPKRVRAMTEIDERLAWEVPLLTSLLAPMAPGPLLDVGSGEGRVALAVAEKGFKVHGIDLVPELVEAANSQALQRGLSCEFFVGEFAELDDWTRLYRGAFCMWGTLRHLLKEEDQVAATAAVHRRLLPGSKFIVDTLDETRASKAPNLDNRLQRRTPEGDRVVRVTHRETGGSVRAFCHDEPLLRGILTQAGYHHIRRIEIPSEPSRLVLEGVA